MVSGMLAAFVSAFAVVLILMVLLFRSLRWGLLAMVPMTATVLLVYGTIGYIGRDYDMPLAVLSTLVLGIGVDFAIHFIERFRSLVRELGSSMRAFSEMFEEPGRAITRNALVIGVGFVPLLFSSLVPYVVVGVLLMTIMALSWAGTLPRAARDHLGGRAVHEPLGPLQLTVIAINGSESGSRPARATWCRRSPARW